MLPPSNSSRGKSHFKDSWKEQTELSTHLLDDWFLEMIIITRSSLDESTFWTIVVIWSWFPNIEQPSSNVPLFATSANVFRINHHLPQLLHVLKDNHSRRWCLHLLARTYHKCKTRAKLALIPICCAPSVEMIPKNNEMMQYWWLITPKGNARQIITHKVR